VDAEGHAKYVGYMKDKIRLEYLEEAAKRPELLDCDSSFFGETGKVYRALHACFSVWCFADPFNPAILRMCLLNIRLLGYAFFQTFLYQSTFLDIPSFRDMNAFVRGCLVFPAITIFIN
jgi:hypothetical protein